MKYVLSCRLSVLLGLAVLATALGVRGAGFALYETSTRGVAMGGALIGGSGDATDIYNNPAAMTDQAGLDAIFGLAVIQPGADATLTVPGPTGPLRRTYEGEDDWFPPPHGYVTWQGDESWWLGFGIYSPFGLGTQYEATWPGRYNSVEAEITTMAASPQVAYKVSDSLSVAAGAQIVWFDICLKRVVNPSLMGGGANVDMLLTLDGDAIGVGGTAALAWEVTDDLQFGLVYRSEVKESAEGDATVAGVPGRSDIEGDVVLPASYSAGLNYTGVSDWNIGVIATYTGWSSYDELSIDFDPPLLGAVPSSTTPKNWDDVWRLGVGAEYQLGARTALQAGYVYDMDPIPLETADYLLPAGDRHIVSLGISQRLGDHWTLGASYAYLMMRAVDVPARLGDGVLPTRYSDGYAHIIAASLGRPF